MEQNQTDIELLEKNEQLVADLVIANNRIEELVRENELQRIKGLSEELYDFIQERKPSSEAKSLTDMTIEVVRNLETEIAELKREQSDWRDRLCLHCKWEKAAYCLECDEKRNGWEPKTSEAEKGRDELRRQQEVNYPEWIDVKWDNDKQCFEFPDGKRVKWEDCISGPDGWLPINEFIKLKTAEKTKELSDRLDSLEKSVEVTRIGMKCPQCIEEGKTSRVQDIGSSRTLIGSRSFYDEDGRHHHHDRNTTTTTYRCSNGHVWTEETKKSCWCGWPNRI